MARDNIAQALIFIRIIGDRERMAVSSDSLKIRTNKSIDLETRCAVSRAARERMRDWTRVEHAIGLSAELIPDPAVWSLSGASKGARVARLREIARRMQTQAPRRLIPARLSDIRLRPLTSRRLVWG